jgi:hypothetical protein
MNAEVMKSAQGIWGPRVGQNGSKPNSLTHSQDMTQGLQQLEAPAIAVALRRVLCIAFDHLPSLFLAPDQYILQFSERF